MVLAAKQAKASGGSVKPAGVTRTAIDMVRNEGIASMAKGVGPATFKGGLSGAHARRCCCCCRR